MDRLQPATVYDPRSYAQGIRSGNLIFLSGQVALDENGDLVGLGDPVVQADFIWRQIGVLLGAAGATYPDIVKVTTYVVDMASRPALMQVRKRYLGDHLVTSTLVGISALARPEFLVEVEVIASIEVPPRP